MALLALLSFASPRPAQAYGLATHLLIVDLLWDQTISKLLMDAFPNTTGKELGEARRYAYSGAVLQDAGYYYYRGSAKAVEEVEHFSDMTHYARSGDFVTNLFATATDVDELAFALGALTHYMGDIEGHSLATNLSVPLSFANHFPGYHIVTYEQLPADHLQVEFGFDVNAAKLMRLRPPSQFKGQKPDLSLQQLTYAYYLTYGMHRDLTWTRDGFSSRAFYASSHFILPTGTYLRARANRDSPTQEPDAVGLQARIHRVVVAEQWKQSKPYGWMPRPLARLLLLLSAKSKAMPPSSTTQEYYAKSLMVTLKKLEVMIAAIDPHAAVFQPLWPADPATGIAGALPNMNLDTGTAETPGTYDLSDRIHQKWLADLAETQKSFPAWPVPPSAQTTLKNYFTLRSSNWNANEVTEELALIKLLPALSNTTPCPNSDPIYKQAFGWHMVDPASYSRPKELRQPICPYHP